MFDKSIYFLQEMWNEIVNFFLEKEKHIEKNLIFLKNGISYCCF